MAVFTIQSPDGRKIKIEAADEATAIRGAQEWSQQNPAAIQLQGKVAPKVSDGGISDNVEGLDAQGRYDFEVGRVADRYFPGSDKAKVAAQYPAYDTGKLFNAGLTLGFGDEAAGAGQALGNVIAGRPGDIGQAYTDFTALERERQKLGQAKAGGLGTAAEIGGALLSGRPDVAATRAVGLLPTMAQGAKGGAMGGGVYGFGSSEGDVGQRVKDAAGGALFGGAVGAAIPAVVAGARRVISPSAAPAAKTASANILRQEGVDLTAGQATGNRNLRFREAELGGGAASDFAERQADQFTSAALRRVGVTAPRATHDVLAQTATRIGDEFDNLAARNFIQPDQRMATDLQAAWRRFEGSTNPSSRPPVIQRIIADIYGKGQGQRMTGAWYKSTRSELGRLSKSQNPELAEAARDLQHALDDAMGRTIQQFNPADAGAWQEVRRLYRNMLVIEDAATRAGAASAEGVITPQALRSAAIKHNKRAFARGRNDFVDLADAGVSTMTPLPDSGTPGRLSAKVMLPAGSIAGASLGASAGPLGMLAGGVAGAAAPWALGRAMLSGPGRAYLSNQLAAGPVGGLAALLGGEAGRGLQPLLPRQ